MISTSDKARFPGMEHKEFHPENAEELAKELVKAAIENFENQGEVYFRWSQVNADWRVFRGDHRGCFGRNPQPLIDAIGKAGKIRGAVGVVGCNNP